MADAFRGLTLRLGADARPLVSAINLVNKSAGQAQRQMNRLSKALKLDPHDVKAMASRLDLAGDKAAHTAREARMLETALKQAAGEWKDLKLSGSSSPKGIAALAADTREAYAATQRLRAESTHLNADLQHVYDAVKRTVQAQQSGNKSFEAADKIVKQLQRSMAGTGQAAERAREAMRQLVQNAYDNPKESLAELFGFDKAAKSAQEFSAMFFKVREEAAKTASDLKAMDRVEGFRAMQSSLVAARAELRGAAAEAARLRSELYAFGGSSRVARAVGEMRRLDSAMEKSVADAQEMRAAFKMLPASIEAAKVKAHALADAEDTIKHKLAATRAAIKAIESAPGFDKVAATTRNAWVEAEKAEARYAKLSEGMTKLKARAESAEAELKEINMLTLDKPRASVKDLAAAFELIRGEKVKDPIAALNKLEAEANDAKGAIARLGSAMEETEGKVRSANLSKSFAEARAEATKLEAKLAELNYQKSVFSSLGGAGQAFRQFGYGLYSTITPAFMMAGRYAIQAAEDIDAAYRDMRKTVNGTEEDFERLRQNAIDFSRTHVTSAEQMLEIESIGGQLGIAGDQLKDLEAFAHTVSNLDIATNMDTEDIALDLAKLSNIMHFGQEQYDSFADALVRLGNNEPALESDIMAISARFAGMAANVGMTTSDMLGLATAATATGQKAEAAGGSIQRTIARIEADVASGGEGLQEYARISGMTADEFAKTWGDTSNHGPIRAIQAFIEGLKGIRDNGGSVIEALNGLGITGVRDRQLLSGLTNTTDVLAESVGMAGDAWNGMSTTMKDGKVEQAGDAMREAERKSEGFSGALAKMKNNAAALATEMGDGAAPWIEDLGERFKQLTGAVHEMSPEMKTNMVGVMGAAALAGPASVAVGTLLSSIGGVYGVMQKGKGKVTEWTAKLNAMNVSTNAGMRANIGLQKALGVLGSGKGLAGIAVASAAIAGIAGSIQDAQRQWRQYKDATDGVREATGNAMSVMTGAARAAEGFGEAMSGSAYAVDKMPEVIDRAAQAQSQMAESINRRADASREEAAQLSVAQRALDDYIGKGGLTADEQGRLRAAVQLLNDEYGTQYQVVDAANGKIADEKGALLDTAASIDEYIAQKKKQVQIEQLSASYQEAEAQRLERLKELSGQRANIDWLVGQQKQFEEGSAEWNDYQGDIDDAVAYFGKLKEMLDADTSAAKNLSEAIANVANGADEAKGSVGSMVQASADWNSVFSMFGDESSSRLAEFARALDMAGVSMQEMESLDPGKMITIASAWDTSGQDIAKALQSVGINAQTMAQQLSDAIGASEGGLDWVSQKAVDASGSMDAFAQALAGAGISVQQLSEMGAAGFDALYEAAGEDMSNIQSMLSQLNALGLDPKNLAVTDDGLIDEVTGKLYELDQEAHRITATERVFRLEEDGSLTEITGELEQADGAVVSAELDVASNADEVQDDVDELYGDVEDGAEGEAEIDYDDVTKADGEVTKLKENVGSIEGKNIDVNVYGNAVDVLSDIQNRLSSISTTSIRIDAAVAERASGGISSAMIRRIPRNASGGINGIVTRPTLTNIGWVGEAGAEAVMHMRNAGGAVVPLSNARYVRPFARAVASEMGGGKTVVQHVTIQLRYDAGSDAKQMVDDIAREMRLRNLMEA